MIGYAFCGSFCTISDSLKELSSLLDLDEIMNRPIKKLSGGQRRRIDIARALLHKPRLLILDEPLHGLDTANREWVRKVIDAFCSRPDKTLIMVTHYPDELPTCITHHKHL